MHEQEKTGVEISVVLPAHNEAGKIETAVRQTKHALAALTAAYEILIAEDGSTDGTADRARRIAAEDPLIRHMHSDERLGRGKALNQAFKRAHGDIVMYMDVDLSTDLSYLKPLINALKEARYDFATGSRMMNSSFTRLRCNRAVDGSAGWSPSKRAARSSSRPGILTVTGIPTSRPRGRT